MQHGGCYGYMQSVNHRGLEVFRAVLAVDAQRAECGGQLLVHRLLRCSIGIAELCADQVRLQRQSQVSWKLEANHGQLFAVHAETLRF